MAAPGAALIRVSDVRRDPIERPPYSRIVSPSEARQSLGYRL
jgi:hypothetical protein